MSILSTLISYVVILYYIHSSKLSSRFQIKDKTKKKNINKILFIMQNALKHPVPKTI